MIKSGIVQEKLADITQPHLPPLTNLPQWSRINTLDKSRYPKPFVKDQRNNLANQENRSWQHNAAELGLDIDAMTEVQSEEQDEAGLMTARVNHLERSLIFIQKEHQLTLHSLHAEIDELKRENKELHFQVINFKDTGAQRLSSPQTHSRPGQSKPNSESGGEKTASGAPAPPTQEKERLAKRESQNNFAGRVPKPPSGRKHQSALKQANKDDEFKLKQLDEENNELKKNLREEVNRNMVLSELLEQIQSDNRTGKSDGQMSATSRPSESQSAPVFTQTALEETREMKSRNVTSASMMLPRKDDTPTMVLPYATTLDPLRVTIPPHPSRPPTLAECETVIRHLLIKTNHQGHELTGLKSDLREALYSHKWTPDAYLLAKAYVVDDDARETAERNRLPKIALSQQNRRLPESAYTTRDQASLPPLKQTLGNKAIERRKRTQILQQTRRSKEVFH